MNYIPSILVKLQELHRTSPDLSFGDILYSILRKPILKETPDDLSNHWLREIDDHIYFNAVSRLIKEELEYKSENA